MNDIPEEINSEFPVEIDLAMSSPSALSAVEAPSGKNDKKIYPSLYIGGTGSDLSALPKEGYALIYFKRRSVTIGERDGEAQHSADLEIQELCLPEAGEGDSGDLMDAAKGVAKKMGVDTGETEAPEEDAGETEEE